MVFKSKKEEILYNLLKKEALERFDSVFDAAEWVKETLQKELDSERLEEKIPHTT